MKTQNIADGTIEPVTLPEAKEYARVLTGALEDTVVMGMIRSARRAAEEFARISIVQRQWVTTYRAPKVISIGYGLGDSWHDPDGVVGGGLVLPRRPVVSLDSLKWRFRGGTEADAPAHFFDIDDGKVHWAEPYTRADETWTALVATYTAGFAVTGEGADQITQAPWEIKQAILVAVAHYYETRSLGKSTALPPSSRELLRGWWQSASVA